MSALSPNQQPTVLFSINQNNTWTIRCLDDETIDPATQRIILKIVGFYLTQGMCYSHFGYGVHNGAISITQRGFIVDYNKVNAIGQWGKIMITVMGFAHTVGH